MEHIRKPLGLFMILLIGSLCLIGVVYAIANLIDWKVPILNPPDETYTLTLQVWYPNLPDLPVIEGDHLWSNLDWFLTEGAVDTQWFIPIVLTYTGELAEGQTVQMKASASTTNITAQNVEYVQVSFEGASIVPQKYHQSFLILENQSNIITLHRINGSETPNTINLAGLGALFYGSPKTITWLTEGDYCPTVTFFYSNSSTLVLHFPEYRIHVNSSDVLRQEEYNRINTALSISLFAFAAVGIIEILSKIWKWSKETIGNRGYEDYA